ncbi:hypothetical protein BE20_19785 [Sorangium cellulosum]|uniref:Uncharacterized protein n=1 Tax=Sorangium cellulosum TaxID=56 RepID=A0A150SC65_SORCE|nr:hypothetical protein BE18_03810 [Sorangium cellulosum]KYF89738.1 hypothetical protein BE20_19785 [Sorangium cellulosum]
MATKKTSSKEAHHATLDDEDEDATHALELLAGKIGEPPRSSLQAILAGTSDADLVSVGKTILSSRIVTDAARIYRKAWDFYQEATDEQRRRLRGFSKPLLAVAVQQALALEQLDRKLAAKSASAGVARAARDKATEAAQSRAIELRDQAYDALRDAAGRDEGLRAQVDAAFGTATTSETLARGLEQTAKLLREWLGSDDEALTARLGLANLDDSYAKELATAAKDVRNAAANATNRPADGTVTQGALDRADGINILIMGQILRAFEGAHGIDPTIPRLVPISTRRLFSRKTKKKAPESQPLQNGNGPQPTGDGETRSDG